MANARMSGEGSPSRAAWSIGVGRAARVFWRLVTARRSAELVGYERHRYQNMLQVLSGWLELDQMDRAEDYLARIVEEERQRSTSFRRLPRWAQLEAVAVEREAAGSGCQVHWRVASCSIWAAMGLMVTLEAAVRRLAHAGAPQEVSAEAEGRGFRVGWPGTEPGPGRWPWPGVRWWRDEGRVWVGWRWREEG
jgi:hypothetical protein